MMSDGREYLVSGGSMDNYLNLAQDEFSSAKLKASNMSSYASIDGVMKDYRSLECFTCGSHFGYQHRVNPNVRVCASQCLPVSSNLEAPKIPTADGSASGAHRELLEQEPSLDEIISGRRASYGELRASVRNAMDHCSGHLLNGYGNVPAIRGGYVGSGRGSPRRHTRYGGYGGLERKSEDEESAEENSTVNGTPAPVVAKKPEAALISFSMPTSAPKPVPAAAAVTPRKISPTPQVPLPSKKSIPEPVETRTAPKPLIPVALLKSKPMPAAAVPSSMAPPKLTPDPVKASTQTKPVELEPVKKVWKNDDIALSPTFADQVACTTSFIWEPTKFTLAAVDDASKLEKLQSDIAEFVATGPRLSRVPAVDDILFAPYEGEYYRGRVDKVDATKEEVFLVFIDFGDEATAKFQYCYEPCDRIMKENPAYGLVFNLNLNVPLPTKLDWVNEKLQHVMEDSVMYLEIDQPSKSGELLKNRKLSGKLLFEKAGKRSLNEMIEEVIRSQSSSAAQAAVKPAPVSSGSSKSELSVVSAATKATLEPSPVPTVATPASPASVPETKQSGTVTSVPGKQPSSAVNPFAGGKKPVQCLTPIRKTVLNTPISDKLVNGTFVIINYVWNDALVSVSAVEDEDAMRDLEMLINDYIKTEAVEMSSVPKVNDLVIAPYNGVYYRGKVTKVTGDKVKVAFVDYGDENEVHYTKLKEMSPEIAKHPIYGVIFRMDGIPETNKINDNSGVPAEISVALEKNGQIEIKTSSGIGEFTGNYWVTDLRSWNDIMLESQ